MPFLAIRNNAPWKRIWWPTFFISGFIILIYCVSWDKSLSKMFSYFFLHGNWNILLFFYLGNLDLRTMHNGNNVTSHCFHCIHYYTNLFSNQNQQQMLLSIINLGIFCVSWNGFNPKQWKILVFLSNNVAWKRIGWHILFFLPNVTPMARETT